jgi:hypothetical protein
MNILVLYNQTQTYTNNVFDHLQAFSSYSKNCVFYTHVDSTLDLAINFNNFDALIIHYSVRIIFDQINAALKFKIAAFSGIKIVFIQDEHEYHNRACIGFLEMSIDCVFTCVPTDNIEFVYPQSKFPAIKFLNCLTGYVSDHQLKKNFDFLPASGRSTFIGYRGRPLGVRYGELGLDKVKIGKQFKEYCVEHSIPHDIESTEEMRIYGDDWYHFIGKCRGMLGTESGSNVFDWDGNLVSSVQAWRSHHPSTSDMECYDAIIKDKDINGLMNQISPRVFETIIARTVLVLYEGLYSNIIKPDIHYLAVKKDGSNIAEVVEKLQDGYLVDKITQQAYDDIIRKQTYSYSKFISYFDEILSNCISHKKQLERKRLQADHSFVYTLTCEPIRHKLEPKLTLKQAVTTMTAPLNQSTSTKKNTILLRYFFILVKITIWRCASYCWSKLPNSLRVKLKPVLKVIFNKH